MTTVITKEDFEKRYDGFKLILIKNLLEVGQNTQVTCPTALVILKKLSVGLNAGQLLEFASSKLTSENSDISKKAFLL